MASNIVRAGDINGGLSNVCSRADNRLRFDFSQTMHVRNS
jgi:hypothetical protein